MYIVSLDNQVEHLKSSIHRFMISSSRNLMIDNVLIFSNTCGNLGHLGHPNSQLFTTKSPASVVKTDADFIQEVHYAMYA